MEIQIKICIGVDPASEVDNFSIVVIEINADHRRIVHCWTTNRSEHKDKVKKVTLQKQIIMHTVLEKLEIS